MTDTIAGIPVEVLPPKVQAGLRTHLTLQMAVSADAIRSVFGGREEHVVRQLSARSGAQVQLWPGQMLLYESARLLHARPRPMAGDYFASVFLHYRPTNWDFFLNWAK